MFSEQRLRALLFYTFALVFFAGLPYILSYALGYKFDARYLKFTKTGIIAIETQPAGASVYLNGKVLDQKTPATIQELLPGKYNIKIELEKHYPWSSDVEVKGGRVSRLDQVILFPLLANVKQLNQEKISSFQVDPEKSKVYYLDFKERLIYRSDLDGGNFQNVGSFPEMSPEPKAWKLSPDRKKILFFNPAQIVIVRLSEQAVQMSEPDSAIVLNLSGRRITDAFWHSDSYHLLVVTQKGVEVLEASDKTLPIELFRLNNKNTSVFYDGNKDVLYFLDTQKAAGENYDNVYRLELNFKTFPFQNLMRSKNFEQQE